jgi:transposase-like protein
MNRKRRNWSPEEKAAVVLEIIREDSTLAEISKKYDIAQPVLSRWKADFIANMASVFDKKGEEIEKVKQEYEAEKERLVQKIGELTLDVDFLKKKHKQVSEMRKRKP